MAITAPITTGSFPAGTLNPQQAAPYFEEARRRSVVQQLARQVRLGPNGEAIPVTTGKPTAGWVSEGGQKPASEGARGLVTMQPEKLATIAVVSAEVVRANPAGYVTDVRDDIAEAFAIAFDAAVMHGTSSPFATNLAATTKSVEIGTAAAAAGGFYGDLVAGLSALVNDGKRLTGFAFGEVVEPTILSTVDTTGRPIFIETPPVDGFADGAPRAGRLIGRPARLGLGVDSGTLKGFGGDWSKIVWGAVGGISYSVSTEATVTINGVLTSLWENNLVGILAEAEYGMVIEDEEHFVKYVDAV